MKRFEHGSLLKHSLILMAATQVGNIANLLFHVVMGRQLRGHVGEYAELTTMLDIVLIIATPMGALQVAMAHFAALLVQDGKSATIPALVRRWCVKMAWPSLAILVVGFVASPWLMRFFHMAGTLPILLTSVVLAGVLFLPILIGALQGLQSFIWMSLCQQSWAVVRLLAGALLVMAVSATSNSGLSGQTLGVLVSGFLGVWGIRANVRTRERTAQRVTGVTRYFLRSFVVLAGYAVLMNADMVMVKHFFADPKQTEMFAWAATIGRTMVFITMPIAMAMFPKVASRGTIEARNWKTLIGAVLFVAAILAAAGVLFSVFAWVPLWVIYGETAPTPELIRLVRWMVWAMAPLGLSYLLMNFQIAQRRFAPAYFLVACAIAYVTGVAFFHATLGQVISVLAAVSTLSAVALILGLPWRKGTV